MDLYRTVPYNVTYKRILISFIEVKPTTEKEVEKGIIIITYKLIHIVYYLYKYAGIPFSI